MNNKQKLFFKRFVRKTRSSSIARYMEMNSSRFISLFSDTQGKEPNNRDLENFKTLIWEWRNYLDLLHSSLTLPKGSEEYGKIEEIIDYVISNNSKRIFFGSFFIGNRKVSLESVSEIEEFREKYGFMFDVVFKKKAPSKKPVPKIKSKEQRIKDGDGKFKKEKVTDVLKRNEFMRQLKEEKSKSQKSEEYSGY